MASKGYSRSNVQLTLQKKKIFRVLLYTPCAKKDVPAATINNNKALYSFFQLGIFYFFILSFLYGIFYLNLQLSRPLQVANASWHNLW